MTAIFMHHFDVCRINGKPWFTQQGSLPNKEEDNLCLRICWTEYWLPIHIGLSIKPIKMASTRVELWRLLWHRLTNKELKYPGNTVCKENKKNVDRNKGRCTNLSNLFNSHSLLYSLPYWPSGDVGICKWFERIRWF